LKKEKIIYGREGDPGGENLLEGEQIKKGSNCEVALVKKSGWVKVQGN